MILKMLIELLLFPSHFIKAHTAHIGVRYTTAYRTLQLNKLLVYTMLLYELQLHRSKSYMSTIRYRRYEQVEYIQC